MKTFDEAEQEVIQEKLDEKDKRIAELERQVSSEQRMRISIAKNSRFFEDEMIALQAQLKAAVEIFPLCADRDSNIPFSDLLEILAGETGKGEA